MYSKKLDFDPFSGIEQIFHHDPDTGESIIESRVRDVEPRLDANVEMQNDPDYSKDGIKSGWWHYAHIPNIIIEKWINEKGVNLYDRNDQKKIFALLNDPEYRKLKTTSGRHEPKR